MDLGYLSSNEIPPTFLKKGTKTLFSPFLTGATGAKREDEEAGGIF
jgi:hypothetical protein